MPYLAWPRARLAAHLVALAGATMVPVLVFALIVLVSLWQHHRATVQRGLVDTTRAQAFVVQREFESTVLALEDLARSEHLERPDLAAFAVEAEQVRRRHPTWSTVVLVKPSGEQVLNLLRPVGTPLPDLAYADATRRLLATGRPTVSALARSPLTGRHVSGVGITVSGAGGVRYLLFAVIDQASWAALLERWNIEPDWFGIIVDQGGTIVARTRRPEFVGQPATEEYRRRTFQATEGVFRQPTLEGVPVYVSWARVPLGEWSVALAVPAEAVDGPPLRRVAVLGLFAVVALALAGVLATAVARRLNRSIRALSAAADALAHGSRVEPSRPSPVEEVDEVQRALQRAADVLAERTAERELLLAREQARRREAEAIAEIGRSLTEGLDVGVVSRQIGDHARALLGALAATVYRLSEPGDEMAMVALSGNLGPAFRPGAFRLKAGEGLAAVAARERRAVVSADILADPQVVMTPAFREAVERSPYRAAMAVPLVVQSRVLGVFSVVDRVGRTFTDADVQLAERFAAHAAIALNNAELYEAQREARHAAQAAAERAKLLAEASRLLGASPDHDATLRQLAELLTSSVADWCTIYLLRRDGSVRRVAGACSDPAKRPLLAAFERRVPPPTGDATRVLLAGGALFLPSVPPGTLESAIPDPDYLALVRALDPQSMIVAPLLARGRFLGSLILIRTRGTPYTREDADFASDLAARAAIAVDNSRLYRQAEHARGEAEAASRAKDEFLAMLGHELRNPLAAVANALGILALVERGDERAVRAREVVNRQVRHLAALVDDLLDVARVTTGKIALTRRPLDLAAATRRVLATMAPSRPGPGPKIEAALRSVWVDADETRIEQVVSNLLGNALKFTGADGAVHVNVEPNGGHAQLVVRDTGAGIPADLLPRVFDLFVQGARGVDRSQGGLGIGLTLVRRLVELHGGTVTAWSAGPGHGSTFTVRLPAIPMPAPPPEGPGADVARRPLRILVVEDNSDTREMLEQALRLHGHRVTSAADGATGLDRALADRPDAAVIDIGLPGLDGYEVARRIRASGGADMFLVAVTGYARDEDRAQARAAGFDAHLPKPVEPPALLALIAEHATRSAR